MFVLPDHPISLDFAKKTVKSGDSSVFGLVMGIPGGGTAPGIYLYNSFLPNRASISFDKSKPNENWGKVVPMRRLPVQERLRAVGVSETGDIYSVTENAITVFTERGQKTVSAPNNGISLVQCSPVEHSDSVFMSTDDGSVLLYKSSDNQVSNICKFTRPVIDMSIDPYRPSSVLAVEGKSQIHMIDAKDSSSTGIPMGNHISSVAFAPEMPFVFAAGQLSGTIGIYDMRMPSVAICSIQAHDSEVSTIKWSPHNRDILASGSLDTAITIWSVRDVETSGNTVFAHNGHVSPIVDFDWCKDVPWTLASVSEDNLFELWTVAQSQIEDYMYNV